MEITISIPLYNVEPYVERCLLSALNQRFDLSYDVLVVDDCSTDRSLQIVQQIQQTHPRGGIVRIIQQPENRGLGEARNVLIEACRSKYLLFLDSDDWLSVDALATLYELAQQHEADVVAGSTDQLCGDKTSPRYQLKPQVVRHPSAGVYMHTQQIDMNIEMWNKLFRTEFLHKNQLRCTHRVIEDSVFDFCMRVAAQTIVLTDKVTYHYTIRQGSILSTLIGSQASDQLITTHCDIISTTQKLITERFSDIVGIYDLYCLRLVYFFYTMKQTTLSTQQQQLIETSVKGFSRFIPTLHSLRLGIDRYMLLMTRINGEDWQAFEQIYNQRYTRKSRLIAGCLSLI